MGRRRGEEEEGKVMGEERSQPLGCVLLSEAKSRGEDESQKLESIFASNISFLVNNRIKVDHKMSQ